MELQLLIVLTTHLVWFIIGHTYLTVKHQLLSQAIPIRFHMYSLQLSVEVQYRLPQQMVVEQVALKSSMFVEVELHQPLKSQQFNLIVNYQLAQLQSLHL